MESKIGEIYFNPKHPAGFGSFKSLRKHLAKSVKDAQIKLFLSKQESHTLHAPAIKRFKRDHVFVSNIDENWQVDLFDMSKFKLENSGATFVLLVIDVLSKFLWLRPLKNKTGPSIKSALEDIINKSKRQPVSLASDKGKEFYNSIVKNYLSEKEINHFSTENSDIKCSVAERAIRTIKQKIWRYFTYTGHNNYINVLQDIASSYNESVHRSIGMQPSKVTDKNFMTVWRKLYSTKKIAVETKFVLSVGNHVRISKVKQIFEKGFENNWSKEIYTVRTVLNRKPTMYELKDLQGENIVGRFYGKELQKVVLPDYHQIDQVIRSRGVGLRRELFVSWRGYPQKFNSWISARDLQK